MNTPNQESTELSLLPKTDTPIKNRDKIEAIISRIKEIKKRRTDITSEISTISSNNINNPQDPEIINKIKTLKDEDDKLNKERLELTQLQTKLSNPDFNWKDDNDSPENVGRAARPETLAI